ncbi:MAG: hypothetical protein ACM3MM_10825, partial [Acidobacteriota bacterium]
LAVVASGCGSDDASSDVDTAASTTMAPETMTGTQICERLTVATVAADLGLDVTVARPDDSAMSRCEYEYVVSEGVTSTLTVAAVPPEDAGGADAFDAVVDVSRAIAGDGVEEQTINAGEDAVRLSGSAFHVGVLDVGGRIYTLVVPVEDAEPDGIDRLVASMATTLG